MAGQKDRHHDEADVKNVDQRHENRILGHVFVHREKPSTQGGQHIFPAKILEHGFVHFSRRGNEKDNPQDGSDEKRQKGNPKQWPLDKRIEIHGSTVSFTKLGEVFPIRFSHPCGKLDPGRRWNTTGGMRNKAYGECEGTWSLPIYIYTVNITQTGASPF